MIHHHHGSFPSLNPPKKRTFSRIPNPAFCHFFHGLSYLDTESAENFRAQDAVVQKMHLKVQMRNTRLDVYLSGCWIKAMAPQFEYHSNAV